MTPIKITPTKPEIQPPPLIIQEKLNVNFVAVKCGLRYTILQDGKSLILKNSNCLENGKLYSCGYGSLGELGLGWVVPYSFFNNFTGKEKTYAKTPTLIDSLEPKKVKRFSCGTNHVLAITTDNKAYAWGDGSSGKLGIIASRISFKKIWIASIQSGPTFKPRGFSITQIGSQFDNFIDLNRLIWLVFSG